MKKWILFLAILLLVSCKKEKVAVYFTSEKALKYFREVEAICNKDNGKLWGKNLYGPLMFVDRPTRKIFANQPDKGGILKGKDGIYTGDFPKELIIESRPLEFGGTIFAITLLPPQEDDYRINSRAIFSLFHSFQKTSGLEPAGFNTRHMDDKNARLWLKLEWRALRNAINNDGDLRVQSIRDALIFRGARRELYPKSVNDENEFEDYQGLSTFTSITLCEDTLGKAKRRLIENLDRTYSLQSYGRNYGFIHGALYAYLAHEKGYDYKTIHTDTIDLGNEVKTLYNIQLPSICRDVAGSLALSYDIESIYKEEEQRLADIKERIHKEISTFTEKPVVYVELESPYFDFEPEDIRSLDTLGTIYSAMRVSDNWGKLTVDKGGCLVSYNLKFLRIPVKNYKESNNKISGDGWHLMLNNDWEIVKVEQNYFVRKLMP
jgi:hypothetical protein